MRPPVPFVWRGGHHLYTGIFFTVFGLFSYWMNLPNYPLNQLGWFWQLITAIGVFMMVDDIIEHKITGNTPLRILFEKVIMPILKRKGVK